MATYLDIDPDAFEGSNTHAFWIDETLHFRGCNSAVAQFWGLASKRDYIGKTHQWLKTLTDEVNIYACDTFVENNAGVLHTSMARMGFIDVPLLINGSLHYYETQLIPLMDRHKKTAGVLGLSRPITQAQSTTNIHQWINAWLNHRTRALHIQLTWREKQVTIASMLGLTTLSIAKRLCLSPRTVETYLNSAIHKLNMPGVVELRALVAEYLGVEELFSAVRRDHDHA